MARGCSRKPGNGISTPSSPPLLQISQSRDIERIPVLRPGKRESGAKREKRTGEMVVFRTVHFKLREIDCVISPRQAVGVEPAVVRASALRAVERGLSNEQ